MIKLDIPEFVDITKPSDDSVDYRITIHSGGSDAARYTLRCLDFLDAIRHGNATATRNGLIYGGAERVVGGAASNW